MTDPGGVAILFDADQTYATDSELLKKQFSEPVETEFQGIPAAPHEKVHDLSDLLKLQAGFRRRLSQLDVEGIRA